MKDTFNTVDFCDSPGCSDARVTREDLQKPHLPTHDLMKVRRTIHTPEFGQLNRNAINALERSRELFQGKKESDAPANESAVSTKRLSGKPGDDLRCTVCKQVAIQPCWFCIQCPGASKHSPHNLSV